MSGLSLGSLQGRALVFERGPDPGHPYQAEVDGHTVVIRLGDFPVEAMHTLIVDGEAGEEFDDWPKAWKRPGKARFLDWIRGKG